MRDYTIKEAAGRLDITPRHLYDLINRIEIGTSYRFERVFLGNYFMGKPRKQLVISEDGLARLQHFQRLMRDSKMGMKKALMEVFVQGM